MAGYIFFIIVGYLQEVFCMHISYQNFSVIWIFED